MSERQVKGILGTKLGMTQVFDENNRVVPVTVVKAGPNVVTQMRTKEKDGYSVAVQLARATSTLAGVNKPRPAHFREAGVPPRALTSLSCAPPTRRTTRSARRSPPNLPTVLST